MTANPLRIRSATAERGHEPERLRRASIGNDRPEPDEPGHQQDEHQQPDPQQVQGPGIVSFDIGNERLT